MGLLRSDNVACPSVDILENIASPSRITKAQVGKSLLLRRTSRFKQKPVKTREMLEMKLKDDEAVLRKSHDESPYSGTKCSPEVSEDLEQDAATSESTTLLEKHREERHMRYHCLLHGILLSLSFSMLILAHFRVNSTLRYVREYSAWSPAEAAVQYDTVQYNITTKGNHFVGAGPEVDDAWREISYNVGDQWISKSDLTRLQMPEWHIKVRNPKTGEDGYRVGIEVFHQMHCLDLLRRVTYKDYYGSLDSQFTKGKAALQAHTDHCIEVLRHQLMCNADIGVFTLYLVEGDPLAWPELNTKHVCRDFDGIRKWALENTVGNMEVNIANE